MKCTLQSIGRKNLRWEKWSAVCPHLLIIFRSYMFYRISRGREALPLSVQNSHNADTRDAFAAVCFSYLENSKIYGKNNAYFPRVHNFSFKRLSLYDHSSSSARHSRLRVKRLPVLSDLKRNWNMTKNFTTPYYQNHLSLLICFRIVAYGQTCRTQKNIFL
jgi:hypothetical protein